MNYDIITIGSANIDVFLKTKTEVRKHLHHIDLCYRVGEKLLVNDIHFKTGGGGTNTAVAFSRLGLKTGFIGVLGKDDHAKIILDDLKKEKIKFLGKIKQGETGYAVILNEPLERTILVYKGVNNNLEWSDIPAFKAKWLYLTTILGKGQRTLEKIAFKAKKSGVKIALNTSMYLAKQGLPKLSHFLNNVDVLVLNKEEALALARLKDIKSATEKIQSHLSPQGIIVVTDSFRPVNAYDGKQYYIKKFARIKPHNTTGAGDAFASGFIYGIIKQKSIPNSLELGHKESASVLMHLGAKDGLLKKL